MNIFILRGMVLNEVRMRLRRTSSIAALLAVIALTWLAIPDPRDGMALMHAAGARLVYDSMTLSIGSASLLNILFGLGGFYLVRGGTAENMRLGIGSVVGATPVGNVAFLFGRWLAGMAYLVTLGVGFMATVLVLHAVRGEAPIDIGIYLQTYALMLLPAMSFAAGMAVLCESWGPTVGKAGDIAYFIVWCAQFSSIAPITRDPFGGWNPLFLIDFNGVSVVIIRLIELFHSTAIGIGMSDFDASVPPRAIAHDFWNLAMIGTRCASLVIGMLPLLPAALLFHRFSPDRIKVGQTKKRGSPIDWLNRMLRPLARTASPLLARAARLPGLAGGIAADVALGLITKPALIIAIAVFALLGIVLPTNTLGSVAIAATLVWGIAISDVPVRDHAVDLEAMSGALAGGEATRYLRHLLSTAVLGALLTATVLLRWLPASPLRAAALAGGLMCLTGTAHALGRMTRTARTFLALFLFTMYVSGQVPDVGWLDIVGGNGSATPASAALLATIGIAAAALGWAADRRAAGALRQRRA